MTSTDSLLPDIGLLFPLSRLMVTVGFEPETLWILDLYTPVV